MLKSSLQERAEGNAGKTNSDEVAVLVLLADFGAVGKSRDTHGAGGRRLAASNVLLALLVDDVLDSNTDDGDCCG